MLENRCFFYYTQNIMNNFLELLFGSQSDYLNMIQYYGPRFFMSILCGFLIGFERQIKNKSFGLRTSILVCLGSMIYASISGFLFEGMKFVDQTRIAAQIVSGIGFLGAGLIMKDRGSVYGATTAATIWMSASIGMLIGFGLAPVAFFGSVSVVLILVALKPLDTFLERSRRSEVTSTYTTVISTTNLKDVHQLIKKYDLHDLESYTDKKKDYKLYKITYRTKKSTKRAFLRDLSELESTNDIKDTTSFGKK